jgi:hypothetical protein
MFKLGGLLVLALLATPAYSAAAPSHHHGLGKLKKHIQHHASTNVEVNVHVSSPQSHHEQRNHQYHHSNGHHSIDHHSKKPHWLKEEHELKELEAPNLKAHEPEAEVDSLGICGTCPTRGEANVDEAQVDEADENEAELDEYVRDAEGNLYETMGGGLVEKIG